MGESGEEYAEHLLGLWRSYAPNMTRDKVLAMKIQDPTDTERLNDNLVNGVDVVGDMTPDQMGYFRPFAGWSSYRTPGGPVHVRRLLPAAACTRAPGTTPRR